MPQRSATALLDGSEIDLKASLWDRPWNKFLHNPNI